MRGNSSEFRAAMTSLANKTPNLPRQVDMLWLALPGVAFLSLVFVLPLVVLLSQSVYDGGFTPRYIAQVAMTGSYLAIIGNSIKIAVLSTVITILLAYPVSCHLMRVGPTARSLMMAMIIVPFWTNILARCYAWIVILQKQGLVNTLLVEQLGVLDQPLDMVYNLSGVLIGMAHYLLPPAILLLYSINRNIDMRLVGAAQSLGASRWRAFVHVFLPLSMPGVRAATLLVLILGLGFYVIPALLGGLRENTLAMLINNQFSETVNWHLGAAMAMVLLMMTLVGIGLYYHSIARTPGKRSS